VHLFLSDEADTPARNFRIWQKIGLDPLPYYYSALNVSIGAEHGPSPVLTQIVEVRFGHVCQLRPTQVLTTP
jgi:hypothetical protein